jgi:hypothetical protein
MLVPVGVPTVQPVPDTETDGVALFPWIAGPT